VNEPDGFAEHPILPFTVVLPELLFLLHEVVAILVTWTAILVTWSSLCLVQYQKFHGRFTWTAILVTWSSCGSSTQFWYWNRHKQARQ